MPRQLLYLIVFIEGFCSLGAEVIALRRLVPHVGSAIVVTAPTIGFFLLALALGYAAGARVSEGFTRVVARNFLISALLAGPPVPGQTESPPGWGEPNRQPWPAWRMTNRPWRSSAGVTDRHPGGNRSFAMRSSFSL